jgi:transcriptional regulator with XRE-family HTH domain
MSSDQHGAARLGELIRQTRQDRNWTQQDLAEESGVSVETIKRYENAKTKYPEPELIRKIFRSLKIDVREIPVALGLVSREEMGLPHTPPRRFSPATERLINAFEGLSVSDEEKQAFLGLIEARKRSQETGRKAG